MNGRRALRLNLRRSFFANGGHNHLKPLRPSRIQHKKKELAIARNKSKTSHDHEPRRGGRIRPLPGAKLRIGLRLYCALAAALRTAGRVLSASRRNASVPTQAQILNTT